jgi:hypothetical protein
MPGLQRHPVFIDLCCTFTLPLNSSLQLIEPCLIPSGHSSHEHFTGDFAFSLEDSEAEEVASSDKTELRHNTPCFSVMNRTNWTSGRTLTRDEAGKSIRLCALQRHDVEPSHCASLQTRLASGAVRAESETCTIHQHE